MIINATAFSLPLKDESVHCCVTSPPYWGLRRYSGLTGEQFGLEPTLELYIEHSMAVLRECWRVLRKDGTCWWNLGDSYAGGGNYRGVDSEDTLSAKQRSNRGAQGLCQELGITKPIMSGLKPKDLCLVPYRFALAAQARGWWIRSAIIWAKPNPMPESCTDRPTDAYEHIFLMTKAKNYWYDAEAVRERSIDPESLNGRNKRNPDKAEKLNDPYFATRGFSAIEQGKTYPNRNLRNVWTFATQPYAEAHFATFPEELPRRCILAGCPEKVCAKCGAGWVRILERSINDFPTAKRAEPYSHGGKNSCLNVSNSNNYKPETKTLGWKPPCSCPTKETSKGICLDPFSGSGTVCDVAVRSGRIGIGIELSREYIKLAMKRTENSRRQTTLL